MKESTFPRRVAVLGSSGSIGQSTLEVITQSESRLIPVLLSVHRQTDVLARQIRQIQQLSCEIPQWIVITDETADRSPLKQLPHSIEICFGHEALCELVRRPEVDIVLSAIVGSAGLTSTLSALDAGKTIALANKESLVMGGELLTHLVQTKGGRLLPVDSEHSAVMQTLRSWNMTADQTAADSAEMMHSAEMVHHAEMMQSVAKIILTASGGPFRTRSLTELANVTVEEALSHPTWTMGKKITIDSAAGLANVTVEDALAHPTWKMGKKITIDSATLMNKALEMIEASWLFYLPGDKIDVVIHPQSLIHSMVEFVDGSIIAQMGPPDMRLPIQLALYYPHRFPGTSLKWDWRQMHTLEFFPPDFERFPALRLAKEVIGAGGTAGAVVNAANEAAVAAFLDGRLPFQEIVKVCESVLHNHDFEPHPTLEQLLSVDRQGRQEAEKRIKIATLPYNRPVL